MCINIHPPTSTSSIHIIHIHPRYTHTNWNTHVDMCRFVFIHISAILRPAERWKFSCRVHSTSRVIVAPFIGEEIWGSERFKNVFEVMELGNNRVWTCTRSAWLWLSFICTLLSPYVQTHTHTLQTCPCSCLPSHTQTWKESSLTCCQWV